MPKHGLSRKETDILQTIYKCGKPMTANEIAKETHKSWNTIKKYITSLIEKKLLTKIEKNGKTYYKITT